MPERFTETLRAASEAGWSHAVGHRFVKELFVGSMPDAVMASYLTQDHRFLDSFLVLLGAALVTADTFEARLRLGRFVGEVSSEENTYFLRALEALGVTDASTAPTVKGDQRTPILRYKNSASSIMQNTFANAASFLLSGRHDQGRHRMARYVAMAVGSAGLLPQAEEALGQVEE